MVATYAGSGSSSGIKLYLNGERVDDANVNSGTYSAMENQATPVWIGQRNNVNNADGVIDEVRIWNRELSNIEVLTLYAPSLGDNHSLDAADGDPEDSVYVDDEGNVGIGTTSPCARLEVIPSSAGGVGIQIPYEAGNLNVLKLGYNYVDADDNHLHLKADGQTIMYLNKDTHNVGIGTTNPGALSPVDAYSAWDGSGNILEIRSFTGSGDTGLLLRDGVDNVGADIWQDNSHGNLYIDNRYSGGNYGIAFRTRTTSTPVDAMSITGNGNVGIGTTSPSYKLDVNGNIRCASLIQTSDIRLKEDITPIDNALEKVTALCGVGFNWRVEEYPEKELTEGRKIGLIAQEVEEVLPEVVSTDDEGYKAVEYGNLVGVLVEAIKVQQAQIEKLQKRIEDLENR